MTVADMQLVDWLERDLHPFGPVDLSIPGPTIDAVCGECGLVIATDLTGECPECLAPTNKEDER